MPRRKRADASADLDLWWSWRATQSLPDAALRAVVTIAGRCKRYDVAPGRAMLRLRKRALTDWTAADREWAQKAVGFVARMGAMRNSRGADPTPRDWALMRWGHNPYADRRELTQRLLTARRSNPEPRALTIGPGSITRAQRALRAARADRRLHQLQCEEQRLRFVQREKGLLDELSRVRAARAEQIEDRRQARQDARRRLTPAQLQQRREAGRRSAERRRDRLDEDRANIPRELWPLWDAHGHRADFAPTGRTARWERFLEWAESSEGIDELTRLQDAALPDDDEWSRLEREYYAANPGGRMKKKIAKKKVNTEPWEKFLAWAQKKKVAKKKVAKKKVAKKRVAKKRVVAKRRAALRVVSNPPGLTVQIEGRPPTESDLRALRPTLERLSRTHRGGSVTVVLPPRRRAPRRSNPADDAELVDRYSDLHWGDEPSAIVTSEIPPPRSPVVALGALTAVRYATTKGGEYAEYEHDFEDELPALLVDAAGHLYVEGGSYSVDRRGIVG